MSDIASRLALARGYAKLSARGLSDLAGLDSSLVQKIETGSRPDPRSSTTIAICDVLGIRAGWLIAAEGPDPDPDEVRVAVERARAARATAPTDPPPAPEAG